MHNASNRACSPACDSLRAAIKMIARSARGCRVEYQLEITGSLVDVQSGDKTTISGRYRAAGTTKNGVLYLKYADDSIIDGVSIPTTLKIKPAAVTIIRQAPLAVRQEFCEGKRCSFTYQALALVAVTHKLVIRENSLSLSYTILSQDQPITKGELKLVYQPV